MRTFATLKNFTTSEAKDIIVRNLNRILDIVIIDLDIEQSSITFLHSSKAALDKAKKELYSIGFPIQNIQVQKWPKADTGLTKTFG